MIDFSDYVLLGFDFRLSGDCINSVDGYVWEPALDIVEEIMEDGYKENLAQLLSCPASVIEKKVSPDVVGVAIAVSTSGYAIMKRLLFENLIENPGSPEYLLSRGWDFKGLDVADANGYFSVFGIDSVAQKLGAGGHLFSNEQEAEVFINPATKLYPSHSPFVIFAVFTYEMCA